MTQYAPDSLGSLVFAGGGTAGHVSPLLAMVTAVQQKFPNTRITVLGTETGLEAELVPAAGFSLTTIPKVPLPRRLNADLLKLPGRLRATIRQVENILRQVNADAVIGVGGYVSTPAYLAARRLGIPVILHEANRKPGLANKLGAIFATQVATAYPDTKLGKNPQAVGMPMRAEIAHARQHSNAIGARTRLGLEPDRPTLVVTGGSSGALSVNEAIAAGAEPLLDSGAQILHLTGHGKNLDPNTFPALNHPHYHQREYLAQMQDAYLAADLMVTRAGAGTVFELTAVGVPTVFVPLPVGNGEQKFNVQHLVAAGATNVVDNADFTADWVRTELPVLLGDTAELARQGAAMAGFGITDSAERMVHLIEERLR